MTEYTDIIARLEAATGADRELDAAILNALFTDARLWIGEPRDYGARRSSDFTASLNAALALVGEKLPGWFWEVGNNIWEGQPVGQAELFTPDAETVGQFRASTPALAVLLALFRALEANKDQHQ